MPTTNIFLSGWPAHSDLSYAEGHYAPFAVELFTSVLLKRYPSVAIRPADCITATRLPADATLKEAGLSLKPHQPRGGISDASSHHPFDHRDPPETGGLVPVAQPPDQASDRTRGLSQNGFTLWSLRHTERTRLQVLSVTCLRTSG